MQHKTVKPCNII